METEVTRIDISKLRSRLKGAQLAAATAIELGDCGAVARFTCESARLQDAIQLAGAMLLDRGAVRR